MWHNRLGHPASPSGKFVVVIFHITIKRNQLTVQLVVLVKFKKLPFHSSFTEYVTLLQLVHTDLWVPSPTPSVNGYRYHIYFIDACTKVTWLYLLRNKAFKTFCNFKAQAELQLSCKIKNVRFDWGGEYMDVTNFLIENGIHHRVSCPGELQQNGTTYRKHGHIVENGLALLANAPIPRRF